MRILLVEDDQTVANFVVKGFNQAGFAVDWCADGLEGQDYAEQQVYDCLIVDVMLPGKDGLSLIESLRRKKIATPILVLSAKGRVMDRVNGLQRGGDDYLTKPFAFAELLARVQALLRRSGIQPEAQELTVGDLSLNLLSREAHRQGQTIPLQTKEYELLAYLMRHPGVVVSKTMIIENVWNYNFDPSTNIVEVRMSRLRDKIDRPFEPKLIRTIRGAGYMIRQPDGSDPDED